MLNFCTGQRSGAILLTFECPLLGTCRVPRAAIRNLVVTNGQLEGMRTTDWLTGRVQILATTNHGQGQDHLIRLGATSTNSLIPCFSGHLCSYSILPSFILLYLAICFSLGGKWRPHDNSPPKMSGIDTRLPFGAAISSTECQ